MEVVKVPVTTRGEHFSVQVSGPHISVSLSLEREALRGERSSIIIVGGEGGLGHHHESHYPTMAWKATQVKL